MLRDLLRQDGFKAGRKHVATLMRRMGIEALYRKPRTTKPGAGHKVYPYLLRNLSIDRPNQVWAMDITYIPMARGFVYLAAVVDWYTRRVLSWKVSITMDTHFVLEAVEDALAQYGTPEIMNSLLSPPSFYSFPVLFLKTPGLLYMPGTRFLKTVPVERGHEVNCRERLSRF